ncbi:MAG: hypothetical protein V1691_01860, partial [Chloroflexota bacterium]
MGKEFDDILEKCLQRVLAGETVAQCLQGYPRQAAELEPLLQTALDARDAARIEPGREFREKARYQFQAALREKQFAAGRRFFSWRPQWAATVAVAAVLLLVGSTVAAASGSMPDE